MLNYNDTVSIELMNSTTTATEGDGVIDISKEEARVSNFSEPDRVITEKKDAPAEEKKKKDWPGNRVYLYGFNKEGRPVLFRYIPFRAMSTWAVKKALEGMLLDRPDIVELYQVDNSRDIHEAFNRACSKYRPTEDRAIFKMLLQNNGICLYDEKKEA